MLAATPVALLFVLILHGRWSTSACAGIVAVVTAAVAALFYRADTLLLGVATGKGLWLGLWILGVVWPALLLYRIAKSAGLERIGEVLMSVLPRRRESLLLLAWLFPSFLQGVAGFGTPIAVAAPLLVGAGWPKTRAVLYPLIGYHWSVTFGSMGSSFYMASLTAQLPPSAHAQFALRASLLLAVNCLLAGGLVLVVDGGLPALREGARMLLLVGLPMGVTLVAVALTVPAVGTLAAGAVGFVVAFALSAYDRARARVGAATQAPRPSPVTVNVGSAPPLAPDPNPEQTVVTAPGPRTLHVRVLAPYAYLLVTALPVFLIPATREWVGSQAVVALAFPATTTGYGWTNAAIHRYTPFAVFGHPGFYILLACALGYLTYRHTGAWPRSQRHSVVIVKEWARSLPKSSVPILLLASVATIMADAGMVSVLARGAAAAAGDSYPLLAPVIGALGSFMTGSTTTSNALFAGFQRDVAELLSVNPVTLLAAQTVGGNIGNAVAPVVALIGLTAVDGGDRVGAVLRCAAPPVLVLLLVVGVVTSLTV